MNMGRFFFLSFFFVIVRSCVNIPSDSVCTGVLPYSSSSVANSTSQVESYLLSNFILWDVVSPLCRRDVAFLMCSELYPPCGSSPVPCQSVCDKVVSSGNCSASDVDALRAVDIYNLDCSTRPTTDCYTPPSAWLPAPQTPSCAPYTGSLCPNIKWNIYQTVGVDWTVYEAAATGFRNRLVIVSTECQTSLVAFICGILFPRCDDKVLSRALQYNFEYEPVFPSASCGDVCEKAKTDCAFALTFFNYTLNCSTSGCGNLNLNKLLELDNPTYACPVNPKHNWQDLGDPEVVFGSIRGAELKTNCTELDGNLVATECPFPFARPRDEFIGIVRESLSDSLCELMCPADYLYSDQEWQTANTLMYFSIPSFLLLTLLLLTFAVFEEKRKQKYIIWFLFSSWCISTLLVFGFAATNNNLRTIGCRNSSEGNIMSVPSYCGFQGFLLFYFTLVESCWWLVIAFELFIKVVLFHRYSESEEKRKDRLYHVFAWGFPWLMLFIFLAAGGKFGSNQISYLLFCWIYDAQGTWVDYFTWFAPISVMWLIGGTFVIFVLREIHKTSSAIRGTGATIESRWEVIRQHLRPIIFVLVFFVIFFWFFVFKIFISESYPETIRTTIKWAVCIYQENFQREPCRTLENDIVQIPNWIWYGLHGSLSMQGIILVLVWGIQPDVYALWKEYFRTRISKHTSGGGIGSTSERSYKWRSQTNFDQRENMPREGNMSPESGIQLDVLSTAHRPTVTATYHPTTPIPPTPTSTTTPLTATSPTTPSSSSPPPSSSFFGMDRSSTITKPDKRTKTQMDVSVIGEEGGREEQGKEEEGDEDGGRRESSGE